MLLHAAEILLLTLLVVHAGREIPKDLRRAQRRCRMIVEHADGWSAWRKRAVISFIMICATAICVAPAVYYGMECLLRASSSFVA